MISFILSFVILVLGYVVYGKAMERIFAPNPKAVTPAVAMADGVDYVPMPTWRVFMVQFLNIAGTGPIFGAIMGAKFGPSSYLWIVLGCIFAGAVHDYFIGMQSVRHEGALLPGILGHYLGKSVRHIVLVVTLILLLLVGVVFVYSPALILGDMPSLQFLETKQLSIMAWVGIIFLYYIMATMFPVDKLIGRIYPLFAMAMLFMAIGLLGCLLVKWPSIPELWDGLHNWGAAEGLKGLDKQPIFPCLFITIACGAVSGFHATQTPIMARCLKNERLGRPVFYGAMIAEGLVALIWAAVSSYFFFDGGAEAVGSSVSAAAPTVVTKVSQSWLGTIGGILAIIGVVAAPITSGDTAFRSARLTIAEFIHLKQTKVINRLLISIPVFIVASVLLWYNIADENGFNVIWRYFGLANQTLACFTLWCIAIVWYNKHMPSIVFFFPALFMTMVCLCYLLVAPEGFRMPHTLAYIISGTITLAAYLIYVAWVVKQHKLNPNCRLPHHAIWAFHLSNWIEKMRKK